ncbi:MAG TPA: mechanosensitive ion channel domain-containing protein [Bacteriovoracaceae bacterium]|nr:mechanosensitive ion channel domain-containing protein [Bacteriovoracaceae bacterium]
MTDLRSFLPENYLLSLLYLAVIVFITATICKFVLTKLIRSITEDFKSTWSRVLFSPKFLYKLSLVVPLIIIYFSPSIIVNLPESLSLFLQRVSLAVLSLLFARLINILLNEFNDIYSTFEQAKHRPIKGIIQVIVITVYFVGSIFFVASLVGKEPWYLLSGLGAMTAVLLLVFRDTILSLVAGIQLTTNKLIQVGDWIQLDQFGANGSVVDIALHTVAVKNWDNTITNIPTHKFLENSFVNYRAMQESGGRRIKRSIFIDLSTVRFLTDEEIEKFSRYRLLTDYIRTKVTELAEHNKKVDAGLETSSRKMTNVGTFRAYLENYLKQHPMVHQDMSLMVRHLEPGQNGLPIEVYVFIKDVRWVYYEKAQADIFDHIFSMVGEFGLRVHQNPSGHDLKDLMKSFTIQE